MVSQNTKRILILALLIALLVPLSSAVVLEPSMVDLNKSITFADLGLTGQEDVQIWVGDTLVEYGNTSGADVLYQPLQDYLVVTRPALRSRWLNNPALFLVDLMDYLMAFSFPLFVILGFCAILFSLSRYGRKR
jgi:hypothetical protein